MTIFRQYEAILKGDKTETRRLALDTDYTWICGEVDKMNPRHEGVRFSAYSSIHAENHRTKWQRGKSYPVIPKRGECQVWHRIERHHLRHSLQEVGGETRLAFAKRLALEWSVGGGDWRKTMTEAGFQPSYIEVARLHRELLQDITEADAIAEGVESVDAYHDLWESIHGKVKGARWADNPAVYVVQFKVVGGSLKDHLQEVQP